MNLGTTPQPELIKLGRRLRSLRKSRSWTLGELSQRVDISEAYLSRIESSDRQPSLAVLINIAQAYGTTLPELFQEEDTTQRNNMIASASSDSVVVRAAERPLIEGNGLLCTSLAGEGSPKSLHPVRIVVPVTRQEENLYRHNGEEWLYVLSGQILLTLNGEKLILNPGDSAHFDASLPHRLSAMSVQDAEVILVACANASSLLESYFHGSSS